MGCIGTKLGSVVTCGSICAMLVVVCEGNRCPVISEGTVFHNSFLSGCGEVDNGRQHLVSN